MPRCQMVPKNGQFFRIILVCRVSDPRPGKQDIRSVDDQEAMLRTKICLYIGDQRFEVIVISGSGGGENLNRPEFKKLERLVETGDYDLVLAEDLSRILRRVLVVYFGELCVDTDTRLVALGDNVDTYEEGWLDMAIMCGWQHEKANRTTRKRIDRSNNRFKEGGWAAFNTAGVIKPPDAKSDLDWYKDPEWEPIYAEWFRRLDEGQSYTEIADWLNEIGAKPGPFCRLKVWDCRMVSRQTHNIMLKGWRYRHRRESVRNRDGVYRTRDAAPEKLETRPVPHLAFFEEEYYDRIVADVDRRNACYKRGKEGTDPLVARPKKRTRFPGQITFCGVCGRPFVFGGHGQTDRLMCTGARDHKCWNGVTADSRLTSERVLAAVLDALQSLPEFDSQFLALVNQEANETDAKRANDIAKCKKRVAQLESEFNNLTEGFRNGKKSPRRQAKLDETEAELDKEEDRLKSLHAVPSDAVVVPEVSELRSLVHDVISDLPIDGWEFCREMRKLVPRIVVFPYQLVDGGKVELRARFKLNLAGMLADERLREVLSGLLEHVIEIDLFRPPQRAALLEEIFELRKTMTERAVAAKLKLTITATQRAASLRRKMMAQALTDPWIAITEPSDNLGKLKRHKHKRYKFDPLPDPDRL